MNVQKFVARLEELKESNSKVIVDINDEVAELESLKTSAEDQVERIDEILEAAEILEREIEIKNEVFQLECVVEEAQGRLVH